MAYTKQRGKARPSSWIPLFCVPGTKRKRVPAHHNQRYDTTSRQCCSTGKGISNTSHWVQACQFRLNPRKLKGSTVPVSSVPYYSLGGIFVSPNVNVNKEVVPNGAEIRKNQKRKSNKLAEQINETYNLLQLGFPLRKSKENLLDTSPSTSSGEIMTLNPTPQNIAEEED
ncbi:hypothetical protein TNCV_2414581 [Trichonephila clavipes]|nr:hypothetical protein TNCV_2414581 [Trichonephila clavipes]